MAEKHDIAFALKDIQKFNRNLIDLNDLITAIAAHLSIPQTKNNLDQIKDHLMASADEDGHIPTDADLMRELFKLAETNTNEAQFKDLQIGDKFLRFGKNGQLWVKLSDKQAKFLKNVGKKTAKYNKKPGSLEVFPLTMDITLESVNESKYKAPKDADKSTKPTPRKDLKDYEGDDAENMVPNSTGEKQKNVLRKTDKEVIDNGSIVPDMKDADRAYKPEGEHDPKHAAKVMSKRQDDDEKDAEAQVHDEKENLVREYIRQKVRAIVAEEFNEQVETDTELNVNGYETRHFDMCPAAVQMFNNIDSVSADPKTLKSLAAAHDILFMYEKNPDKFSDPLGISKRIFKKIVDLAEQLGVRDEVMKYLPQHLKVIKQKVDQMGL